MQKLTKSTLRLNLRSVSEKDTYAIHQTCLTYPATILAQKNYFSHDANPIDSREFYFIGESLESGDRICHIKGFVRESIGYMWIQSLIVYPNFLRSYYGTEIFYGTIDLISSQYTIHTICLTVIDTNTDAHLFWQSLEFRPLHNIQKNFRGKILNATVYEKKLTR